MDSFYKYFSDFLSLILFVGSVYDSKGDYNVQGWWSNKTKLSYNTTTNCFIDYFNNKTMGPFAIAGQFSLQPVCFLFQNGNQNMKYNVSFE